MAATPFHDRDGFIWCDGELLPWRDVTLHVLSHALHYASAVFEGERSYGGRIFKLREHTERLFHSAEVMGFKIPFAASEIDEACYKVLEANEIADGYVRPVAWRGSEMMGVSAQAAKIHVAIAAWPWPSYFSPDARLKGIRLKVAKWKRPSPETAPAKTKAAGLYMICTLSKHSAEAEGYDDALMLDWRGHVAEATGANIFLVIEGQLHTPTPDCFLDGITRRTVIGLATKRGIEVIERTIMLDDFAKADEVFLTGTAAEVTPVSEIDQYHFQPGQVCRHMMDDYDQIVRAPGAGEQAAPAE